MGGLSVCGVFPLLTVITDCVRATAVTPGVLFPSRPSSFSVSPLFQVHAHSVLSCGRCFDEEQVLFPFLGHALSCLWADQGVRAAVSRGYEYELNDSAL